MIAEPGPRESVWEYPRPPAIERCPQRIRIVFDGRTIAETENAWRILETSHPPVYYLPREDIAPGTLSPTARRSFCEWKGEARYFDVTSPDRVAAEAAWSYPAPTPAYESIRDHVAFYAGPMEACYVGDECVEPQPGGFYGGWITSAIEGPFKGVPGNAGW